MKRTIRLAIPAMLLLAAVLLGGPAATAAQAHPSIFPDVAETHPAHVAIESLVAKDIVSGTLSGTFLPDDPVSRGQAAKIITNWRGVEPSSAAPNFSDVDPAAAPFVEAASGEPLDERIPRWELSSLRSSIPPADGRHSGAFSGMGGGGPSADRRSDRSRYSILSMTRAPSHRQRDPMWPWRS